MCRMSVFFFWCSALIFLFCSALEMPSSCNTCVCSHSTPVSLPATPVSQRARARSCSPSPTPVLRPTDTMPSTISTSGSWEDLFTSMSSSAPDVDLFPSSESTASSSLLSDISSWSDLPLFSNDFPVSPFELSVQAPVVFQDTEYHGKSFLLLLTFMCFQYCTASCSPLLLCQLDVEVRVWNCCSFSVLLPTASLSV